MTTDHEMRMEALRLFEENERLLDLLGQVNHTLIVHGHVDRGTHLHRRIDNALSSQKSAPVILVPHNNGERVPSSDAALAGADTAISSQRLSPTGELFVSHSHLTKLEISLGQRDALARACQRALVDLRAAQLLMGHFLGEPHGINQTIEIVESALEGYRVSVGQQPERSK